MLDYLSLYGNSFQTKIIAALMSDSSFLAQSMDILSSDYFESDTNKFIIDNIIDYHHLYNTPPTFDVFKTKITSVTDEILKSTVESQLKDAFHVIENASEAGVVSDLPFVKNEFLNFCKNKKLKEAIISTVELLKSGKYDEIKSIINDAMKAGMDKNIGLQWSLMDVDERYSKVLRKNLVPTEWPVLNDIIQGGLGAGDLGVLVGSSGGGKSWALVSIGLHALSLGKTVVHFTMELKEDYVGRRYDSRMTGIASQNLDYHIDEVKRKKESYPGQLIIKDYPTKTASVSTLKAYLDKIISMGIPPNIVLIDYADLLKSEHIHQQKAGSYFEMGSIYEDLRGMAGVYDIPVWTPSQAHRCIFTDEFVTEQKKGRIKICSITEGDYIETHDGYKKVTKIFDVENQPAYKIKLKSGKTIIVSKNHDFPTKYGLKSINTGLVIGDKLFTKK